MDTQILEQIGLTKGEIAVYFALLELGSSSVGPVAKEARISSSKIYDVLERLIRKGLASHVIKENVKYFEAAPPKRILEYVEEKQQQLNTKHQQLKQLLPELELRQKLTQLKAGAQIFKGNKGWQTSFGDILHTLQKGDELLVTGIFDFDDEFQGMIKRFHTRRAKAGITARILLNHGATSMGSALTKLENTEIRYFNKNMTTPGVFLIYANKTLITLPNQRTFIQIENEEATQAFRAYFEAIWGQEIYVYEGLEQCTDVMTNILSELNEGEEYFVLNGNYGGLPELEDFFEEYHKKRQKKGIKANILFNDNVRKEQAKFTLDPMEKKFLPPDFNSPLQATFYNDKLYLSVWKESPLGVLIHRQEIVDAFKAYFDSLWNQDTQTWRGKKAISLIVDDVINSESDLYLIGAHGYMPQRYPDEHKRLVQGVNKNNKKRYHLSRELTRNTGFNEGATTHYLPEQYLSPMVIWVYGDTVAHAIWDEEITVLRVKNTKVADDYRTYFSMLKKMATN